MHRPACAYAQSHKQCCYLLFGRIISRSASATSETSIFMHACLSEETGMRLALSETQKIGFLASWPRIFMSLRQILQEQQIIIFKKKMRRLFIRYVNGGHIIWLRSTSSNTQVIHSYSPQSRGNGGDFLVSGFRSMIWPCTNSSFTRLALNYKMTGAHNLFRLYALVKWPLPPAQGNVEEFDFCVCSSP